MKVRRIPRWRLIYAACAGAVLTALLVATQVALTLERDHRLSQEESRQRERHDDRQRAALWRIDSRMLPLLAREGARPYFEYLAYYPQECGYTRYLAPIGKGDVMVPSPLLLNVTPPIKLHFQVDVAGKFSSPQAPGGNQRDLAEASGVPLGAVQFDAGEGITRLARVQELVPVALVLDSARRIEACEMAPTSQTGEWSTRRGQVQDAKVAAKNDANLANRAADPLAPAPDVDVGTFVPLWLGDPHELFFVRRVRVGDAQLLQGIWCDWSVLRSTLLGAIADLVPNATLEPQPAAIERLDGVEPVEMELTTLPARLVVPPTPDAPTGAPLVATGIGWSATRTALTVAWLLVGAAVIGGYFLVGSSVALGERRSRFAAAVTHELRTPLTTFRMYSEMLADGMVADPAVRQSYLETLKEQSGRLALLVENVLAYARVEDGRFVARRVPITVGEIVARQQPLFERRAVDAGFVLRIELAADLAARRITTDRDVVGQILFNLIDNACKYAVGTTPAAIELTITASPGWLALAVRDHGPGIEPTQARAIFEPFERGAKNGDARPGVGLGLALSRGLARDLDGELVLAPPADGGRGACLVLRLPIDS
ncbi:MAG: HAMP domain-containing histidine kinase [Planctomycetes bacterium]|nr:HAMP domain-containing histidine kinase [Planctomycetota bacterium]